MAHPKSRISKQRKRKRRTHYKSAVANVVKCANTGEAHLRHHTYEVDGDIYYRGKLFIAANDQA